MKLWILTVTYGHTGNEHFQGAFTYKPTAKELVKLLGISQQEANDLHDNLDSDPKCNHYKNYFLEQVDANKVEQI